jgi:glycosyltransferase involved in cell wall biosynthesis
VKRPSITAFFPAYNDAGTIASMVVVADRTLRALTDDYEIIVVNDGSPDHTGEILADLAARYPRLRIVTHPRNRGYGGALRSGFAHATKELVFYTDGDARRPVRPPRAGPAARALRPGCGRGERL